MKVRSHVLYRAVLSCTGIFFLCSSIFSIECGVIVRLNRCSLIILYIVRSVDFCYTCCTGAYAAGIAGLVNEIQRMIQPVLPVCEVVDDTVLTTSSTQLNLFRALYDAKENENKELKEENDILKLEIIALKSQVGVVVDIAASSTS